MTVLSHVPPEVHAAVTLIEELARSESRHRLAQFYHGLAADGCRGGPYEWQREFHAMGATHQERCIMAGNRVGKTRTAAAEVAIHATGRYPTWWTGHRFTRPISVIIGEPTNELSRDIAQKEMLGPLESDGETRTPAGTGWIPGDAILKYDFRQCGVTGVIDTVDVRHRSGGVSTIGFKSYEQGAVKFQGVSRDIVWMDEEPEVEAWTIYSEALTRLLDTRGLMIFTRTPLFGTSDIIRHFMSNKPGVWYTTATWNQSPHLDEKAREQLASTYAEHERDTRMLGVPLMGSGAVYPVLQAEYTVEPFPIPKHYRRLCGVDFGIDHPAAAAWIAYDADTDIIYVTDCYRMRGHTAAYHADAIIQRGKWIPCTWPHDGMMRDKGGGEPLKNQYEAKGVNMLPVSACYDEDKLGGQAREPATLEILERMRTGRFKVFSHLTELLEELRMLHRKMLPGTGPKIVAERDDIESAVRYAVMMLRYATTERLALGERQSNSGSYDPFELYARR